MRSVARVDQICLEERRATADGGRLLADDQMNGRLHLIIFVPALDLLLDPSDAQHRTIQSAERVRHVRRREPLESANAFACVGVPNAHAACTFLQAIRLVEDDSRP